jgi:hypothetical protein
MEQYGNPKTQPPTARVVLLLEPTSVVLDEWLVEDAGDAWSSLAVRLDKHKRAMRWWKRWWWFRGNRTEVCLHRSKVLGVAGVLPSLDEFDMFSKEPAVYSLGDVEDPEQEAPPPAGPSPEGEPWWNRIGRE